MHPKPIGRSFRVPALIQMRGRAPAGATGLTPTITKEPTGAAIAVATTCARMDMNTTETKVEHTPGPWVVRSMGGDCFVEAKLDGKPYGQEILGDDYWPELSKRSDAERIVQCVNACTGISDPQSAIQAAREALKYAECDLACYEGDPKYPGKNTILKSVRQALAKLGEK